MTWSTLWPQNRKPSPDDIAEFVDNPLWKTPVSYTHLDVYKRQAFAGAHIEKGTHKIEFRFSPPGKQIGCIISLISLLLSLIHI